MREKSNVKSHHRYAVPLPLTREVRRAFNPPCKRGEEKGGLKAFTLAEVLITLGVIGIVAAITLPGLISDYQTRVRNEQKRMVKYKLTQATDKMKSLGLIGYYDSTESFVNELQKHLKIMRICDNTKLEQCWPTKTINMLGNDSAVNVSSLKKGSDIKALAPDAGNRNTMGLVLADGTTMILVYGAKCSSMDASKTYEWSTQDNKPVTNATTNCISAIYDINGGKKPNQAGKDIRTLNSLFPMTAPVLAQPVSSEAEYKKLKAKGLIKNYTNCSARGDDNIMMCSGEGKSANYANDYWAGAVAYCDKYGLSLPDASTLAVVANDLYGRSDIGVSTKIGSTAWIDAYVEQHKNDKCTKYDDNGNAIGEYACPWSPNGWVYYDDFAYNPNASAGVFKNAWFWSSEEYSASTAYERDYSSTYSLWYYYGRGSSGRRVVCLAD